MKKSLSQVVVCSFILLAAGSCKISKIDMAQRKADIEQAKEVAPACFVQLNDGTIKNYTTLKLVTGVLKGPYLLADGKTRIFAKDITTYQNKKHYAVSQELFSSGHKSYVAKETLPGFAIRIAKGNINVYSKKYYNGVGTVDEYFVQKGVQGKIFAYTMENMNAIVKDDDEALAFLVNKGYNTTKTRKDLTQIPFNPNKTPIRNK